MIPDRAGQLVIVLLIEAVVGYPDAIYRRIRHPVAWIGRLIAALEQAWNAGAPRMRRLAGCALLLVLVSVAGTAGWLIERLANGSLPGVIVMLLVTSTAFAQRSLRDHVVAVLRPLQNGDLVAARVAVARIVGRDTQTLDAEGISTAAIESLAESFCDGVIAPAFWFLIAGVPGLFICKAINTADSMVGHKDERYRAFGWACARADDLVNLVPARIAALLICLAGGGGVRVTLRDARKHASPNAGWSEAAMAGVLARQLGGPVSYDGELMQRPTFGNGARPDAASLSTALRVYWRACIALWLIVGGVAWLR
jgi:adenosylcobinamide-phosphate synthase